MAVWRLRYVSTRRTGPAPHCSRSGLSNVRLVANIDTEQRCHPHAAVPFGQRLAFKYGSRRRYSLFAEGC